MIIYKSEKAISGLAEKINANSSVAYSVPINPWTENDRKQVFDAIASINSKAIAALKHKTAKASLSDIDLYFTKSILVSTNWNKNDDIFSRYPVWAARHTPAHKRTNLEHDEKQLVGHITDTWALDSDGNIIPDDIAVDELPSLYHIANGAVIYTKWEDDDLIERTEQLIEQIEAGEKYVSMEALFSDFDYAVITPENNFHVIARKEDTSYLTQHLRAYGGDGNFDGCRIGRLLKNIVFSGKGYVNKPANPYSVIFDDENPVDFTSASTKNPFARKVGVSIPYKVNSNQNKNMETPRMSDSVELLQNQNSELKQTVADLQKKLDELSKASATEHAKSLEAKISELEEKLNTAQSKLEETEEKVSELSTAKEKLEEELTEANEAKASLEEKVQEAEAEKVKADRISYLVEGGYEKEEAEKKVETFASLDDEQFKSVASELVEAKKHMQKEDKEEKDDKKGKDKDSSNASDDSEDSETSDEEGETSASETDLDDAEEESSDPDLTSEASDESEDEAESLRTALSKTLASRLGYDYDDDSDES